MSKKVKIISKKGLTNRHYCYKIANKTAVMSTTIAKTAIRK